MDEDPMENGGICPRCGAAAYWIEEVWSDGSNGCGECGFVHPEDTGYQGRRCAPCALSLCAQ